MGLQPSYINELVCGVWTKNGDFCISVFYKNNFFYWVNDTIYNQNGFFSSTIFETYEISPSISIYKKILLPNCTNIPVEIRGFLYKIVARSSSF